jgi:hypothetical protein
MVISSSFPHQIAFVRTDTPRSAERVGDLLPADDARVLGHGLSLVTLLDLAG